MHRRAASLDGGVAIDTYLHVVGGNRLKLQVTRRKICDYLRLRSDCAAWSDADEVISVDAIERGPISANLRLNALLIQSQDLCNSILISSRVLSLCEHD